MTDLNTTPEELRTVLGIFKARKLRPGEGILVGNHQGLKPSDISIGVRTGIERGMFRHGPNGFIMLTEAGSAEFYV